MILPTVAFLLVSLVIGVYAGRRIKGSVRNYFVAGNIIPLWVLVLSMTGQAIELGATHENANLVISSGFWEGAVLPIGIGISLIFIGLFFAKPLHRMRLLTLPDFYTKRYAPSVGLVVAVISTVSFTILIAGNLAGLGYLLNVSLGLSPAISVPVVAAIISIYTMAGGLFAVTWNDVLQIGVSIVAFSVGLGWIVFQLEPGELQRAIDHRFSLAPLTDLNHGALRVWASLLALALGDIVALDFMERVFAAGTARGAKASCILAGGLTILVGVMLAVVGMIAAGSVDHANGATVITYIQQHLPAGLGMLFMMGFIGAGISTVDGAIMACSVTIARNVLQVTLPTVVTESRLLTVSRLMALPVAAVAVFIALVFPVPAELLVLAFDVVFAGCLVPLALGVYWKRGTTRAALWAILFPSALRLALHFLFEDIWKNPAINGLQTLVPPVVSLLLFVGISVWETRSNLKKASV